MNILSSYNIIGLVLTIGIVWGIKLMSSPKTAVKGNAISAFCMLGAIALTLLYHNIIGYTLLWIAMIIGGIIGYLLAIKVAMIQMPQMVALLNGLGGGASAIVALVVLFTSYSQSTLFSKFTSGLALVVGAVTLSGSLIAAAKLDRRLKQRPVNLPGHTGILIVSLLILLVSILTLSFITLSSGALLLIGLLTLCFSLFFGVVFAIRIGGADMPITISLLNSMSGVAGSIAGFAIYNPLLVAVGAIVGASGFILTQLMCKAMNRSLVTILTGKTTIAEKSQVDVADNQPKVDNLEDNKAEDKTEDEITDIINKASKVVIVPGYGMALSQAQGKVKELYEKLLELGKEVRFAIHPVAGRMPGHMNVLLAEVDIPYDILFELDEINPLFQETDLVIIIGANDVVNPAARTAEGTPLYGMPVLNVDQAENIFVLNLDTKPGYAGVNNPLYDLPNVKLMLGDAVDSLKDIIAKIELGIIKQEDTVQKEELKEQGQAVNYLDNLKAGDKVIIVPGYGMAVAQAQQKVKQLIDKLEGMDIDVKVAIHPVAGRMPGHMNVLLAEVDVPYDMLYEMEDINDEFQNTDLVIVVGANDVVNPAARTAENTPIYGMPVLRVDEAKQIIICNKDTEPGYAGVDNPLYCQENVMIMLGDAKETLDKILKEL